MFNKKSLLLGAASVLLASGLAGCGGADMGDCAYWCPSQDNAIMEKIVEEFKKDNPDYADKKIVRDANFGEGDTYNALHSGFSKAADVMLMADDNIRAGVRAEEIASVDADKEAFQEEVGADAVNACSVDGEMYGYAYRADNSPMPFFNKHLWDSDAEFGGTLRGMLQACADKEVKFYLDLANGWYNEFLLTTMGGSFTVGKDSKGAEVVKTDIEDHAEAIGSLLEELKDLYNEFSDTWVVSSKDANIEAGFADDSIGIAFLWNDTTNIVNGGGSVGVTMWPNIEVDGEEYASRCFRSYKAVVCKEQSGERLTLAKAFAKYLASKKAQELRISLSYGPSNLELQDTDDVKEIEFVAKANEMYAEGRTEAQAPNVTQSFWTPMANLGKLVTDGTSGVEAWGDYDDAEMAVLDLINNTGWEAE